MDNSATVKILVRARSKIDHRWIQNKSRDEFGGVCAGQAIVDSVNELYAPSETGPRRCDRMNAASYLVLDAAKRLRQGAWFEIPHWNDQPMRVKQDVLDVFDEAIRVAHGEEPTVTVPEPVPVTTDWWEWTSGTMVMAPPPLTIEEPAKATWGMKIKELVSV